MKIFPEQGTGINQFILFSSQGFPPIKKLQFKDDIERLESGTENTNFFHIVPNFEYR
jgi:hypothetical protein